MLHLLMDKGPWFRAKRLGYGAGMPFKWQGWAVIAAYLGAVAGVLFGLVSTKVLSSTLAYLLLAAVTFMFVAIVVRRTERGQRQDS